MLPSRAALDSHAHSLVEVTTVHFSRSQSQRSALGTLPIPETLFHFDGIQRNTDVIPATGSCAEEQRHCEGSGHKVCVLPLIDCVATPHPCTLSIRKQSFKTQSRS